MHNGTREERHIWTSQILGGAGHHIWPNYCNDSKKNTKINFKARTSPRLLERFKQTRDRITVPLTCDSPRETVPSAGSDEVLFLICGALTDVVIEVMKREWKVLFPARNQQPTRTDIAVDRILGCSFLDGVRRVAHLNTSNFAVYISARFFSNNTFRYPPLPALQ